MEPASERTREYQARLQERRAALRQEIEGILPQGGPFVWEIGCGHGHFLTAYAQAHPGAVCLGIDIASDRIARARRKQQRARQRNLHFLRAEATLFLEVLPAGVVPAEIFVLFPDPWPKKRHHKHRLMRPDFLESLARRVGKGTRLHFRTDHAEYAAEVARLLADDTHWRPVEAPWPFELETVFQARAAAYQSIIAVRT